MIVTLGFYKRKPGLTHEEFSKHWREVHGPLIANNPLLSKYIKRYLQHHLSPATAWPNVGFLEFDGFSESWFESIDARKEMHSLAHFQEEIIADERKFIDMDATRVLMLDQQVVQIGKDYSTLWAAGQV